MAEGISDETLRDIAEHGFGGFKLPQAMARELLETRQKLAEATQQIERLLDHIAKESGWGT